MAMSEYNRTGNPMDDPRLARLYREAAREEPPVRLDAAILAAAHRDAGAGPRLLGSAWLRSWRLPVSIAAVVALSVSLVTLMFNEGGDQLTAPPPRPADSRAKLRVEQDAAALPAKPVETASPATRPVPGTGAAGTQPGTQESRRAEKSTANEAKQAHTVEASRGVPQPFPAAPLSGTTEPHAAEAGAPPLRDSARQPPAADIPAAASKSSADLARPPSVVAEESAVGRTNAPPMRSRAVPEAAAPAGLQARQKSALIREYENEAPDKWLEKIAALRREGKTAEADGMLAEFKKRFRDYPVPASLR